MDLFRPTARRGENWNGTLVVLAPGALPTTDYYLAARLQSLGERAVLQFDSLGVPPVGDAVPPGAFAVIVRHAASGWLDWLDRHRERLSGVAFLMDDDIPGAWRCADAPLDYRLWTTGRYLRARWGLARVCDRIWLSTPALQARYPAVPSRVVVPLPCDPQRAPAPPGNRRWGYHGTRVHRRELRWLVPVVADVQRALPEADFEVFGDASVARLFRGIPRVQVMPPLPWPAYRARCRDANLAVGLAPMLPGPFNAVRSHTKLFDIARCGAVGIFAAREPYAPQLAAAGGALLPDDPAQWAAAAIRVLLDDALRLDRYAQQAEWIAGCDAGESIARLIADGAPA